LRKFVAIDENDWSCPISVVCSGIENRLKARDKSSASGDGFAAKALEPAGHGPSIAADWSTI